MSLAKRYTVQQAIDQAKFVCKEKRIGCCLDAVQRLNPTDAIDISKLSDLVDQIVFDSKYHGIR